MFSTAEDTEQNGSQSAFGAPISNGETKGTTTNYPTCTDAQFIGTGLGGAFTTNSANPLPTPTDSNPSANQGDLASSNLDLGDGTAGTGGCYGDAVIDISSGEESGSFGTTAKLTWPSPWVNGGDCPYGSLGSNSAGGNTDTTNASCPPSQADVNEGYVDCTDHRVNRQRRHADRGVQQLDHGRLLQRAAGSPAVDGDPVQWRGVTRRHRQRHQRHQLVGQLRRRAQHRSLRRRPGRQHVPGERTRCLHRHLPGHRGPGDQFDGDHRCQLVCLHRCRGHADVGDQPRSRPQSVHDDRRAAVGQLPGAGRTGLGCLQRLHRRVQHHAPTRQRTQRLLSDGSGNQSGHR